MSYDRPLPSPDDEDGPFWEAAREHRLVLPRCTACGHVWFPPFAVCGRCQGRGREWIEASGRGTVFGVAVFERQYMRAFPVPYHVALVELEEGPLMYGDVVDVDHDDVRVGMAVEVTFDDVTDEVTLPRFRSARS